ncbi:Tyrosine-protein phosphatase 1 [Escovopsis weberi]|uniref:protein-tyrosine-phosphatase n=1 Tax=Escovopsis weberi TaxID=150374 RepID=A0A0M8N8T8_ESCWE|nr:Tyrosine-protein phosphatase 1 [Escovopsis weberi]
MKTSARPSPGPIASHSRSISQSSRSTKGSGHKSTTPTSSPRAPYSVGQAYPPRHSSAWNNSTEARPPSPNYFGLVVDSGHDPCESSGLPRDNWSPSSSIKSFAAALPKHVSLESNPEFEAFKRQVDINNKGKSFTLPTPHFVQPFVNPAPARPKPARWHTHGTDNGSDISLHRWNKLSAKDRVAAGRMDADQDGLADSAYASSESKRNSESSLFPLQIPNLPKLGSPKPLNTAAAASASASATAAATMTATPTSTTATSFNLQLPPLGRAENKNPRPPLTEHRTAPPSPGLPGSALARSFTLPPKGDPAQPSMISATLLKELMESLEEDRLLLLDIRSSQNFGLSRIEGALNLCIPTTLLKRATFNIEKLTQMFQGDSECSKFSMWREMEWIVVYDASASDKKDAVAAQNMIKKFTNEGYAGNVGILRGGFNSFQASFPHLVDDASAADQKEDTQGAAAAASRNLGFAPVIGGVSLPVGASSVNPFFSNIRQNVDLADGVGQLNVSWPPALEPESLPLWLREAAAKTDHGKDVSNKFLKIERDEQTRMQGAYGQDGTIRLSGVEKGGKNRYKDILPFEHARVKLQNRPEGCCDYVNASHLSTLRSKKRYIASQGPLPDTFEDFWSVVWDNDVRVIVMLTAETEGGQIKCHSYWTNREFGPIKLKKLSEKKVSLDLDKAKTGTNNNNTSESGKKRAHAATLAEGSPLDTSASPDPAEVPFVMIRKFAVSHAANPFAPIREVTHLHFPSWPDFGTPAQPSHLLALVELANVMQRTAVPFDTTSIVGSGRSPNSEGVSLAWNEEAAGDSASRPMLVHCSAGCGRTGTFCTVDSVIDMLKRQRASRAPGHPSPSEGGGADVLMMDIDEATPPPNCEAENKKATSRSNGGPANPFDSMARDAAWLEDDSVDLIQRTVEDFRQQRISMVQSLRQFVLCYETVLEWIDRVNTNNITLQVLPGGQRRRDSIMQLR